jgi:hypothetical protein
LTQSPSVGLGSASNAAILVGPYYDGGYVGWLMELHFGDVSEGWVFRIFGDGGEVWVDGWWRGGLLVDSLGGPSSGCKRWLNLLSGITRVVFELRTQWAPNVGVNSRGLFIANTKVGDKV